MSRSRLPLPIAAPQSMLDHRIPGLARHAAGHLHRTSTRPRTLPPALGQARPSRRQAQAASLPRAADAPFVGRNEDRQRLEDALTTGDSAVTCLYGPTGRGKTALADRVSHSLEQTGAFARVIYCSIAGGHLPDSLRVILGVSLVGPDFTLRDSERAERLSQALAETPTLIIIDNIEAAFSPDALHYGPTHRDQLVALIGELAAIAGTRVLLVSDTALCPTELAALAPVRIELPSLDPADAAALLAAYGAAPTGAEMGELLGALGGNALALRCAATYLAEHTWAELMDTVERLMPGAARGEALLGGQNVSLAIELLLAEVSLDDRPTVNALGMYSAGFLEPMALRTLQLDEEKWRGIAPRLARAGLLAPQQVEGLSIARIALEPALQGHLHRRVTPRQRQALGPTYCREMAELWGWLPRGDQRAPGLLRRLTLLELPNLIAAVDIALGLGDLVLGQELIQIAAPPLALLGLSITLQELGERHGRAVAMAIPAEGPLARPAVQFMLRQAEMAIQTGQGEQGAKLVQQLVQRISAENGQSYGPPESLLDQALALRLTASLLKAGGRPEMLITTLRQAAALLGQARGLPEARLAEAHTWHDLAEAFLLARQAEMAEDAVRHGLDIAREVGDAELLGGFQNQMGAIDVLKGDAKSALAHLQESAASLAGAEAWSALIAVWGQVASLHESALQDSQSALQALAEAIRLAGEHSLPQLEAQTLSQRARLYGRLAQMDQARGDLEAAADIYRKSRAAIPLLATLRSLGELTLSQGQLDAAQDAAEEARKLAEAGGKTAPWEVYHLLQRIAAARHDAVGEAHWRAATQHAFGRSPAAPAVLKQWWPLIRAVAESCRGTALSAQAAELIENLEDSAPGKQMAGAIWAILDGARGPEVYRDLDHASALVVRTILHGIDHPELFDPPKPKSDSEAKPAE